MDNKVDSLASAVHRQGQEFNHMSRGSSERRARHSRGRRGESDSVRQQLREYKKKARSCSLLLS